MGTKTTRIVLDVALTAMIVVEMFIQFTGVFLHEVIGFAFFATVVVHLLLSAKWMKGVARGARKGVLSGRSIALVLMAALLAVAMLALGVSSVAISTILESAGFTWTLGSYALWVTVHSISSYALCALVAVHLAMHWAFLASAFKMPYDPARRRAIGAGVKAVATVGAVALGVMAVREALPQAMTETTVEGSSKEAFENASDVPQASEGSSSSSGSGSSSAPGVSSGRHSRRDGSSGSAGSSAQPSTPEADSAPGSGSSSGSSSGDSAVTGICTLCRKQCSLSSPKCDKPYEAGLI